MQRFLVPLLLIAPACSTISDVDWTNSGFAEVSGGEVAVDLTGEQNGTVSDTFGAVHFVSGLDNGARAYAGIGPATDTGAVIRSGTATLTGPWEVVGIEDIVILELTDFEGRLSGQNFTNGGTITLSADFEEKTLTGSEGPLSVNGSISGGRLSGRVTYAGDRGALGGQIGALGAVGAFHGNNDQRVFAGGFVVEAPD